MELTISLNVAPGSGLRPPIKVFSGTTIAQLFQSENLIGRSAVVNGRSVGQDYVLTTNDVLHGAVDILATQVSKGA